jgi:hypothetical protein
MLLPPLPNKLTFLLLLLLLFLLLHCSPLLLAQYE